MKKLLLLCACITALFCFGCSDENNDRYIYGEIGENIRWKFEDDALLIEGNGEIPDFSYKSNTPWSEYAEDVQYVSFDGDFSAVGDFAFAYMKNPSIPGTITEIGNYSYFQTQLGGELELPDGIVHVGEKAFANCFGLKGIYIPKNLTDIGKDAFLNCTSLEFFKVDSENGEYTSVDGVLFDKNITCLIAYPAGKKNVSYTVPESVKYITDGAFSNNSYIETVDFAKNVPEIGDGVFENCTKLKNIMLPLGLTEISDSMFKNCSALEHINIPAGVASIGESAFSNCVMLKEITLPMSLKIIDNLAFSGCTAIEQFTVPDGVSEIGYRAFSGCNALKEIQLSMLLKVIESYTFSYCKGLETVNIGKNLSVVNDSAFKGCAALRTIDFNGTRGMWKNIEIKDGNNSFEEAVVSFIDDLDNN